MSEAKIREIEMFVMNRSVKSMDGRFIPGHMRNVQGVGGGVGLDNSVGNIDYTYIFPYDFINKEDAKKCKKALLRKFGKKQLIKLYRLDGETK